MKRHYVFTTIVLSWLITAMIAECQCLIAQHTHIHQNDNHATLHEALMDEYHAAAFLLRTKQRYAPAPLIDSLITERQQSITRLEACYKASQLKLPTNPWTPRTVLDYADWDATCNAALLGERAAIAMYTRLLRNTVPDCTRQALEANRAAAGKRLSALSTCPQSPHKMPRKR